MASCCPLRRAHAPSLSSRDLEGEHALPFAYTAGLSGDRLCRSSEPLPRSRLFRVRDFRRRSRSRCLHRAQAPPVRRKPQRPCRSAPKKHSQYWWGPPKMLASRPRESCLLRESTDGSLFLFPHLHLVLARRPFCLQTRIEGIDDTRCLRADVSSLIK